MEGLVLKRLSMPWVTNHRNPTSWCKVKPDYLEGDELDCAIIGAAYGSGG